MSSPQDASEREADQVAERIMRMPAPGIGENLAGSTEDSARRSGGGSPLTSNLRSFFEPRFGYDFGNVRIHTDTQADDAATAVDALAYTLGHDVVFRAGQYAPDSSAGRQLLAHELTHVVQQNGGSHQVQPLPGSAPQPLQRKEVPDDSDIKGKQDWTTSDRIGNTKRWQEACLANLNAVDSGQYTRIVERRDFYRWFYEYTASKGYTTRWALAATVVANGAHQVADIDDDFLNAWANEELGLATVELRGILREGNQVIFDNVLPKLKKLLDGGPLKGTAALQWDMQVLAEEQALIQPLYTKMSKDSLAQMTDIATKSGLIGVAASLTGEDQVAATPNSSGGTVPAFSGSLTSIADRWAYGMKLGNTFTPGGSGFDPTKMSMPSVSTDYSGGTELAKFDKRSALHQLDAWLTADADTRVGSGKDIGAIIAALTESDKQTIVTSRGPGDMPYAALFADAKDVKPATIKKALPTDAKFAAAVAQFWKDYAAASRTLWDDLEDMANLGTSLWNAGESLYDTGSQLYEGGKQVYEGGKKVYEAGKDVYEAGESLYDLGSDLYDLVK